MITLPDNLTIRELKLRYLAAVLLSERLSQGKLAKRLGVSKPTILRWLRQLRGQPARTVA